MRKRFIIFLLVLVAIILFLRRGSGEAVLAVHFIDVGQGDSILIQSRTGDTVLIDGGDDRQALEYLQEQGISQLDAVFASHPHADHIGGLVDVLHEIPTNSVWTSGAYHTTATFEHFLDVIDERQIPYHETTTGAAITIGELQFDVLYGEATASSLNNTSLVLRLEHGDTSFLFTGDAESPVEYYLLETVPEQLPTTVLKLGHHGSYSSSKLPFLQAVQPRYAVYMAGEGNSYGHPHQGVLANLERLRAEVYGTDVNGTIVMTSNSRDIKVYTDEKAFKGRIDNMPAHISTELPAGMYTDELAYDPFGTDRNCGDFATHEDAQAFFEAAGGVQRDRHRLDGDNDGIACESLPRRR